MKPGKRFRGKNLRAAILALVTLLAVLLAPVCAPMCAARACEKAPPPASSHDKCHGMNMAQKDDGLRVDGHASKSCSKGDLPAATLNASKNEPKVDGRGQAAPDTRIAAGASAVIYAARKFARTPLWGNGLEKLGESSFTFGVLRI